ncbi:MAG: hypothetical protein AB8B94_17100 [Hyphomicrobiales bacterium]
MTQAQMARVLNLKVRRDPNDPNDKPVVKFNSTTMTTLESGAAAYQFAHLEAYARACGVHTGILLLFSQHSMLTKPESDLAELKERLQRLQDVCDTAMAQNRSLTVQDLFSVSDGEFVDPRSLSPVVDENDLPKDRPLVERLEVAKTLSEARNIDPLRGSPLFDWEKKNV